LLELYGKSASQQYYSRNRFCFTSAPQGRMRGPAAERRFEIGTSHLPPLPRNEEDTTNLLPCLHETGGEHGGGYGASRNWIKSFKIIPSGNQELAL